MLHHPRTAPHLTLDLSLCLALQPVKQGEPALYFYGDNYWENTADQARDISKIEKSFELVQEMAIDPALAMPSTGLQGKPEGVQGATGDPLETPDHDSQPADMSPGNDSF